VGAKDCPCALFKGHRDKIVAIPGALERHKQLAGQQLPRIVVCAQKSNIFILRVDPAAAPLRSLL
jgi:hypothetical protein